MAGRNARRVWFDEEPPLDIYSEGRTRCQARQGIVIITFMPLLGMTDVVKLFLGEADIARVRRENCGLMRNADPPSMKATAGRRTADGSPE